MNTSYQPPTIHMTPDAFRTWRHSLSMSKREAALALGLARNTIYAYETGRHRIPRYIMLACQALTAVTPARMAA